MTFEGFKSRWTTPKLWASVRPSHSCLVIEIAVVIASWPDCRMSPRRAWRRSLGLEAELEVSDDPIDNLRIFDIRDDSHLPSTRRAYQRVHIVDLADHLRPSFRWDKRLIMFINKERMGFLPCCEITGTRENFGIFPTKNSD